MPPPTQAQLRAGVLVNIVLKADQPTGRLTTGSIADILTRGDHPRGIKVRLSNGQIGRVQSLSQISTLSPSSSEPGASSAQKPISFGSSPSSSQPAGHLTSLPSTILNQAKGRMQEDYRNDPTPADSTSLEQYFKKPTQKKKGRRSAAGNKPDAAAAAISEERFETRDALAVNQETQAQLEAEFPHVDAALIAAMVADHPGDIGGARKILKEIST